MAFEELVHALDLLELVGILRAVGIDGARNNEEVRLVAKTLTSAVPVHQTGDVLDSIEARHA